MLLAVACAGADREAGTALGDAPTRLLVLRHAWHTALVLPVADLPPGSPLAGDPAAADWVEIGFGDRLFYTTPDPPLWMALRAALWPSPGVVLISPHRGPPETVPGEELLELPLSRRGLARLHERAVASLELDAAGRPRLLAPGPSAASGFYAARERFHLFRTCNVWTAELLGAAGIALEPALAAGELIARLEPRARRLRPKPRKALRRACLTAPPADA